ncbi:hypothetical protein [Paractinoplanes atraurantiacus]|uniref:Uncharacterized protein n=1 Tax=Paractinoplanes atraurantiacus TaxID=1036182 RepID=A0A285J477_9ACTN|nr:hypothetical protein [Actinoplanes atraurantiacus]SNY53901.1 hypothetical protein SAMN05421748_114204 [Actinoplanes atraurantiacus]
MTFPFKPGPPQGGGFRPGPPPHRPAPPPGGQPAYRPGPPPSGQPDHRPGPPASGQPVPGSHPQAPMGHTEAFAEASGQIVEETGHPAVDAVLKALENASRLAPAEQIAEYEAAHQVFQETLASIDR